MTKEYKTSKKTLRKIGRLMVDREVALSQVTTAWRNRAPGLSKKDDLAQARWEESLKAAYAHSDREAMRVVEGEAAKILGPRG